MNFLVCAAALWLSPWLMLILVVQGFVRGFAGHTWCPAHHVWRALFKAFGLAGKTENAGAKMFSNKILFIASSLSFIAFSFDSPLWAVPCIALMVFTTLEWAFSFCAACSVYAWWQQKFPPKQP